MVEEGKWGGYHWAIVSEFHRPLVTVMIVTGWSIILALCHTKINLTDNYQRLLTDETVV